MGQYDNAEESRGSGAAHSTALLPQSAGGELFMKVLTEEERVQQGTFSQGGNTSRQSGGARFVFRPLDFNDGPVVSLCESTRERFSRVSWKERLRANL